MLCVCVCVCVCVFVTSNLIEVNHLFFENWILNKRCYCKYLTKFIVDQFYQYL